MSSPRPDEADGSESEKIQHPYAAVYVLLLSWKDDDLGVETEVHQLSVVFEEAYGFWVERYLIPSEEPDEALAGALKSFIQRYQSPRSLLIVYYGGHCYQNDCRVAIWSCHQRQLEISTADVLLILDCCQPLGGGGPVRVGTGKQVLAACGFGSGAPGVGEHSFTHTLIRQLMASSGAPFTMAEFHYLLLAKLRAPVPVYNGEQRETPVLGILGEGGLSERSLQLISYVTHPINLIAVMGVTGSGKSSLINRICRKGVAKVGQGQESETKEVTQYTTVINGETLTLIDTPGFDDTYLSDRQILERIATHLYVHWRRHRQLNGLLYLRDINDVKMTGSARKNLDMFQRLCGEDSLENVMLLTTKWDKPSDPTHAGSHESDLINKFWADMIQLGCYPPKRLGTEVNISLNIADPINEIIAPMLRFRPTYLQIQRELGDGKQLNETAAGQYVNQHLEKAIHEYKRAADSAKYQAERSHRQQMKAALDEQARLHRHELEEAKKDMDALRQDFHKVLKSEEERRSKLFGFGILGRLDNYAAKLETDEKYIKLCGVTIASGSLLDVLKCVWKIQGVSKEKIKSTEGKMKYI